METVWKKLSEQKVKIPVWAILEIVVAVLIVMFWARTAVLHSRSLVDLGVASEVKAVIPAVVHITNEGVCQGSGVLIAPNLVVTAKHVVEDGSSFTVTLNDGRELHSDDVIISCEYDLAFIRLAENVDVPPARMEAFEGTELGEAVFVIGSPYGKENFNSVTLGIISGCHRNLDMPQWGWSVTFQTDAPIHPGNSGGPCFDMDGNIIGIVVAGQGYSGNVSFCIPVDVFERDVEEILRLFKLHEYEKLETSQPVEVEYYSYAESIGS